MATEYEEYEYKGLKVVFYKKNDEYHSSVLSGQTLLKYSNNSKLKDLKAEITDFVKNRKKEIENKIYSNHQKFLESNGVEDFKSVNIYRLTNTKKNRVTHCYACGHNLSTYQNYACDRCSWLLCSCGACGCAYNPNFK